MKLSEIKEILAQRNLQLTKSLGQNFLHDQNQIRRIVDAACLSPDDSVLEIGPGLGPLTDAILEKAREVLAIEKDERLVEFLREKYASRTNLRLLNDDALAYVKTHRQWGRWKMAANLPYSVASPILVELAEAEHPPTRIAATLQLEVAQRINAPTDDEHYGVLTLLIQLRYESLSLFKIPSSCFYPEPDVDSACIALALRAQPLLEPALHPLFKRIVKCAFSQRRKMMLKLLKQLWPAEQLAAAFETLGLSAQIRAEKVSLQQFILLTKILAPK
jgi:16S rRNA (adenine1518-N6/adenine1519-N6)-dimethyltransferase